MTGDPSGETRAERPVPGESSEAPGPAAMIMKQPQARGKEKRTGPKQPAAATGKPIGKTVKRATAVPDKAAAMEATEHEKVNMVEAGTMENEIMAENAPANAMAPVTEAALEREMVAETPQALPENGTASARAETAPPASAAAAATTTEETLEAPLKPPPCPPIISAYAGSSLERAPEPPRFNIFIIDSGWNPVATRILLQNLPLIRELNPSDGTYLLDRERSISVLRRHHALIGRDPIISVHDLDVMNNEAARDGASRSTVHGFRLHLGLVKTEEKIKDALEMFLRFLRRHRASRHLEKDVREKLRKEGLAGTIEIMGHGVELFRG